MFIAGLFQWWYGEGWLNRLKLVKTNLAKTADFFSIGILITTLFAPFKQISATSGVNDTIGEKFRAAFDKLFSRIIGAIVRSFMIMFGMVALFVNFVLGIISLALWPIVPVLPIVGLILSMSGWVPAWI